MTTHLHPSSGPRDEFLVDGCPRCAEYERDTGIHFDEQRFRAFWAKMVAVEFDHDGDWKSELDERLGRQLFRVALCLQRAFGVDPHVFNRINEVLLEGGEVT